MLSNLILRSIAAFGGTPFRLEKCTALGSAGAGAAGGSVVGGVPGALVGGALGVASSLLGGLFGNHNTNKVNQMNYKIMQEQNRFNAEEAQKNRNAFDLSHRHMFTAQVGELLPVFTQWVNPNETFKIGYNGKTRTAALNSDAFTRIRENIQYYFVPFQSLWKYFEQQVNNLTKGDAGQNISKFASSSSDASKISTSLPYVSYIDIASWLLEMYYQALASVYSRTTHFAVYSNLINAHKVFYGVNFQPYQ
jgi:hypothetical protein